MLNCSCISTSNTILYVRFCIFGLLLEKTKTKYEKDKKWKSKSGKEKNYHEKNKKRNEEEPPQDLI